MKPQLLASKKRSQAYQEFFAFSIGGPNKTYIEIGAFKPATKSNTYALEVDQGWRGFSMELNQKYKLCKILTTLMFMDFRLVCSLSLMITFLLKVF
jgi:hypothetical protein